MILKIFNHRIGIHIHHKKIEHKTVTGYTNRTQDGKYLVFLDYDGTTQPQVKLEVEELIYKHKLGNSILVQSNKGNHHHFICFDKMERREFYGVLKDSGCDYKYKSVPIRAKHWSWVLRTTPKDKFRPKIIQTFITPYNNIREKSSPHIRIANRTYDCNIRDDNEDRRTKIVIGEYEV